LAEQTTTASPGARGLDSSGLDIAAPRKQWQVILRRFFRHRAALIGLAIFVLLVLFSLIGSLLWKYDAAELNLGRYQPPNGNHPFGTGSIGDDVFAKVIRGTGYSLRIAIVVAILNTVVGVVLGSLAGYYRGWVDALIGNASSNWLQVAIILGLTNWMTVSRTIRGMVLSLREKEFVEAARALGGGPLRVIFRHILPNTMDVVIVNATVAVAQAVLLEAALSFVGLGVQYPDTSLGLLVNEYQNELVVHPWLFYFPFLFIVLISLSVNFVGDGLRDAFDPRQKRVRA
jgi:peptide/nickel transport system permease protein